MFALIGRDQRVRFSRMGKRRKAGTTSARPGQLAGAPHRAPSTPGKPSSLLDTRVVYCGDNLEQLAKLPDACVDLIYIDPPFNSNRNYEVFWGETKEKRSFEDRHASILPTITSNTEHPPAWHRKN